MFLSDKLIVKILFLVSLLMTLTSWAAPSSCGKEGSVEERIKNCNSAKGEFVLVARDEKGVEIYKDLKTGLLWGDRISTDFNHYGSQKACSEAAPESELLKEVKWRLPTVREFELAASHRMKDSLPRMFHSFWTSTPVKTKSRSRRRRNIQPAQAYVWEGQEERADVGDIKDAASVRCVAK